MRLLLFIAALALTSCQSIDPASPPEGVQSKAEHCKTGSTREGYQDPLKRKDKECVSETQLCRNGEWNGPEISINCESETKSCTGSDCKWKKGGKPAASR